MPAGQPTKYEPGFAEKARDLISKGATDTEVADFFGVTVRTLYNWRHTYPEFFLAVKASKEEADATVERALFQRATGYETDAIKFFLAKDGEIKEARYREIVPPDPTAMIFWLKNRKPSEWREKSEVEHSIKQIIVRPDAKAERDRPAMKPDFEG